MKGYKFIKKSPSGIKLYEKEILKDVRYQNKLQHILYWAYSRLYKHLFGFQVGVYNPGYLNGYVKLGKNVRIARNVQIIARNHDIYNPDKHAEYEEIIIEDYCWIGANAVILPGVHLGPHTVVGAGAIVTKSFPEGWCIIVGNPARFLRRIEHED